MKIKKNHPYRKAIDPAFGCHECGHFIGIIVNGGYTCDFCGYRRSENIPTRKSSCFCWVSKDICPIHGK